MPAKAPIPEQGTKYAEWTFNFEVTTGFWNCTCSCGEIRVCRRCHVVAGKSTNCGHNRADGIRAALTKHGLSDCGDRVYSCWKNAKSRCHNENNAHYKTYGARGIKMSDLWLNDFKAFYTYVGEPPSPQHSLGRIDNDKGYEPGNVEWQTNFVQSRNKIDSRYITFKGKTQTITDWGIETGISRDLLAARIGRLAWSVEKALTTPTKKYYDITK